MTARDICIINTACRQTHKHEFEQAGARKSDTDRERDRASESCSHAS